MWIERDDQFFELIVRRVGKGRFPNVEYWKRELYIPSMVKQL